MKKEYRNILIALAVIVTVLGGSWAAIQISSGVSPPFTVVESHSMQHCQKDDKHSETGIIDTGDMILVRDKDKGSITSYVEGSKNGYTSFGDYGNVIIYYRDHGNPVIHRAFLWLEYNDDGTWSAPALEGYERPWVCKDQGTVIDDIHHLRGEITFDRVGNVVQ